MESAFLSAATLVRCKEENEEEDQVNGVDVHCKLMTYYEKSMIFYVVRCNFGQFM